MTESEKSELLRASTAGLAPREQFAFFREVISPVYTGMAPNAPAGARGFEAQFSRLVIGKSIVAHVLAPGHSARRNATGRSSDDGLFVNFSEGGDYEVEDDLGAGRVARRTPRLNVNEGGVARFPEGRRMSLLTLRIPRQAMDAGISMKRLNAALVSTALGRLIGGQFALLGQAMRLANPGAITAIGRSVESSILALADETRRKDGGAVEPRATARHMKTYALARLDDPKLSISALAAAFRCTTRTVQNYFAADGETFSDWILEERLVRAHAMLCSEARERRTIEAIGYSCGFASAAHFHRTFKARFGAPPGAFRKS